MHSKIAFALFACVAAVAAFDPITLTLGSTAYVLTGTQVAVAVASLGALALAKEGLLLAELSRTRGRRDVNENSLSASSGDKLEALYDAISSVDLADCGKLMVCHVVAKPSHELTREESRITKLFDGVDQKINPTSSYAEYQLAAITGSYSQPELCTSRYFRCPYPADQLSQLLKA